MLLFKICFIFAGLEARANRQWASTAREISLPLHSWSSPGTAISYSYSYSYSYQTPFSGYSLHIHHCMVLSSASALPCVFTIFYFIIHWGKCIEVDCLCYYVYSRFYICVWYPSILNQPKGSCRWRNIISVPCSVNHLWVSVIKILWQVDYCAVGFYLCRFVLCFVALHFSSWLLAVLY